MIDLPESIVLHIISYLDYKDVNKINYVNTKI